ncbi:MAG: prephenate dehydrogenase/arogenate dehydrogenase family protein [Anaerolineae bacterium]
MAERIQITIVGLGSIGTSLGLALRQAGESLFIVGHDKDPGHSGKARKLKAVDKTEWNLINACEDAQLVILAIPMMAIQDTLRALAPHLKAGCVITDTTSLKEQVIRWAEETLPESVSFVGGNPLVISGGTGPDAADAGLFRNALYCITPAPNVHPDAVSLVSSMVTLLGGKPYFLDAAEHDGLVAGVEHLPRALALALAKGTMQESAWREMRKLAGGGFERITALIGEDPDALGSLLLANQENLVRWLDVCTLALREVRDLIAQGEHEPLAQAIDQVVVARRAWQKDRSDGFAEIKPVEVERGSFLRQMFLGERRRKS